MVLPTLAAAASQLLNDEDTASAPQYTPFLLYTSIIRAWDTAQAAQLALAAPAADGSECMQEEQQERRVQQQQQQTGRQMWQQSQQQPSSRRRHLAGDSSSTTSSASSSDSDTGSSEDGGANTHSSSSEAVFDSDGVPGLERGLYDEEEVALRWMQRGRHKPLLPAAAGLIYLSNYELQVGGPDLFPEQPAELKQLQTLARDQAYLLLSRLHRSSSSSKKRMRDSLPPAASLGAALGHSYAATEEHLSRVCGALTVPQRRSLPRAVRALPLLQAAELSSAMLVLNDVRALHSEISLTPEVNLHLRPGYVGYWAISVLAGAEAWLGPKFRLTWQVRGRRHGVRRGLQSAPLSCCCSASACLCGE